MVDRWDRAERVRSGRLRQDPIALFDRISLIAGWCDGNPRHATMPRFSTLE